jgi:hypothetical protein
MNKAGRLEHELGNPKLEHFESQAPHCDAVDTLHRGSRSIYEGSSPAQHNSGHKQRQERPGNVSQQQSRRWSWTSCRLLAISIAVLSSTVYAKPLCKPMASFQAVLLKVFLVSSVPQSLQGGVCMPPLSIYLVRPYNEWANKERAPLEVAPEARLGRGTCQLPANCSTNHEEPVSMQ